MQQQETINNSKIHQYATLSYFGLIMVKRSAKTQEQVNY